nr:MAG TPA: Regulatory protein-modification, helix-turn-helix, transcriptional regulato, DNA [Caudoviricetes sp.]
MGKLLSPWCKEAKKALIDMDMTVAELAQKIGRSREYTTAVINGRIYAEPMVKVISDALNIKEEVLQKRLAC